MVMESAGRLKHSHLTESSKYPILLSSNSHLTMLIIHEIIHVNNCHAGSAAILTFLREKFWIPRARQIIKNNLRKFLKCLIKIYIKSYNKPAFPELPHCRVNEARIFQVNGILHWCLTS